jgi:NitT/TauT family transport system permease protein
VRRGLEIAAPILFVALLLAAWEIACRALDVPPYFLPTPSAIVLALVQNAPVLFVSAWRTLSTALMAFAITAALASLAALGAASARVAEASLRPIAIVLQVTPIIALAPLFAVWAGVDHPARAVVALACVAAFFPMYSGALAGLSSADPELDRLFDLYGASGWQRLTRL